MMRIDIGFPWRTSRHIDVAMRVVVFKACCTPMPRSWGQQLQVVELGRALQPCHAMPCLLGSETQDIDTEATPSDTSRLLSTAERSVANVCS